MSTICITNPITKKSYTAQVPVHETGLVWCGIGQDEEQNSIFIKLIRYGNAFPNQKQALKDAQEEAKILLNTSRCTDRVPRLLDHWNDKAHQTYVLVMEKMQGITLRQWMKKRPLRPQDPGYPAALRVRCQILKQVAHILQTIHAKSPGISHLDLKPENIMIWLDQNHIWQVGLVDFGTAALDHTLGTGTDGYQAPERLTRGKTIMGSDESKDVFSLGLLWYELLTNVPQEELSGLFLQAWGASHWEERPTLPPQVLAVRHGNDYQELFEKMTAFNPDKRPRLERVIKDIPTK